MSVRVPKYRLHKGSGQALVQLNGHRIYLGKHGSEESREKYRRIVAEWLANGSSPVSPTMAGTTPGVTGGVLVDQVAIGPKAQAILRSFLKPDAPKGQLGCQARDLKELIGNTPKQVRSSVPILEQVFRTPISEKARVGGLLAKVFEQTGISQPRENMRSGKRVCRFFAIVCDQLYKVDPTGPPPFWLRNG